MAKKPDKEKVKKLESADEVVVEAPLSQRISDNLAKKLEEEKVGEKIREVWNTADANRQDWLERLRRYLRDLDEYKYQDELDESEPTPEGVSQLHVPMPLTVSKNIHARFMQALTRELSPIVRPRRPDAADRAPLVKGLMSYMLKEWANHKKGVEGELDKFVWDWVTAGDAIMKVRWATEFEAYQDVEVYAQPTDPIKDMDRQGNLIEVPDYKMVEKEVRRLVEKFDGPVFETKPLEDVIIVGGEGDPQRADYVLDNYMLTGSDLRTMAAQRIFKDSAVDKVIAAGPDSQTGKAHTAIKDTRRRLASEGTIDAEPDYDRYRIVEAYFGYDVEGTGIHSQLVAWVHVESGTILRATYLHRTNKSGLRPYFTAKYMLRPGQNHGLGVLEILHPLSIEMDFHHNSRIDFGLLSAMPWGFYRASSSVDPEILRPRPGDLLPMEDPQNDVVIPNLGNRSAFGVQEEAAIQTMVERLVGINDMSLGVMSGAQGPTRTARGVSALLGEASTNLDVHLRRLNQFWTEVLRYSLALVQQRIKPGFEFKLLGEDGNLYFSRLQNRDEIAGEFDFELAASSAVSNPQIQLDRANFVVQLQNNPLWIQLGIVTPANIWEAAKNLLQAVGIKETARFITKPQGYEYVMTPEEEANRVLRGIDAPVLPQADHEGFIAYVENILTGNDDQGSPILAQFNEQDVQRLVVQMNKHQEMLQALQAAQQQQNNFAQQQANSLQGVAQANVNLSTPGF